MFALGCRGVWHLQNALFVFLPVLPWAPLDQTPFVTCVTKLANDELSPF